MTVRVSEKAAGLGMRVHCWLTVLTMDWKFKAYSRVSYREGVEGGGGWNCPSQDTHLLRVALQNETYL